MFGTNKKFGIKPNTSLNKVRRGVGKSERQRKRESGRRRARLEKVARWTSGKNVRVRFRPEQAACEKGGSAAPYDLLIWVPTAEHDQPATDLDPAAWDFVFQKAELVHELGHVLYTDFEAMEEYIGKVNDLHEKELFRNMFNIVEDGAIERQLAADYNVGNDLEIKNANLMVQGEPGHEVNPMQGDKYHELNFADAVECILMDWGKYDTERADQLLDPDEGAYVFESPDDKARTVEVLPLLRDLIADVVTEPNGRDRVRITYEYFRELVDKFDFDEVRDDPLMQLMKLFPDDGNVYVVIPGDPPDDAEALEPDEDDTVIFLEPGELSGGAPPGDAEQKYAEQIENDAGEEDDEAEDAVEWAKSARNTNESVSVIQSGDVNTDRWKAAERFADTLTPSLEQVLDIEKESEMVGGQRAGRPETRSLWKLGYGNQRVFMDERREDEKDYTVVILVDRSGSMKTGYGATEPEPGDEILAAEEAAAGLAQALENVGVNVAVLSCSGEDPSTYLEKPFGVPTEKKKDVLTRGHADDGTPLGTTLELARDRLQGMPGEKFVVSITDGSPTDDGHYEDQLDKCTFPVIGVYLGSNAPGASGDPEDRNEARQWYHALTWADTDNLQQQVKGMVETQLRAMHQN